MDKCFFRPAANHEECRTYGRSTSIRSSKDLRIQKIVTFYKFAKDLTLFIKSDSDEILFISKSKLNDNVFFPFDPAFELKANKDYVIEFQDPHGQLQPKEFGNSEKNSFNLIKLNYAGCFAFHCVKSIEFVV